MRAEGARTGLAGALLACAGCFVDGGLAGADGSGQASEATAAEAGTNLTEGPDESACGDGVVDPGEGCDLGAANSDAGACTLACAPAACGDGLRAAFEGCDDGNQVAGDGCGPGCLAELCGDGVVQPPEQCDDGDAIDADDCTGLCRPPACGDGLLRADEECDAGPDNSDLGACTLGCRLATCGDGLVGPGELCDDGNAIDFDACSNTCGTRGCGDGIVMSGEGCDDANKQNTDACLNDCTPALCGDGFVRAGVEACDDGNMIAGDGCSQDCLAEGDPPPTRCGDARIDVGEECDDGDQLAGDGCSALCTKEFRRVFVTSATYTGGLGGLAGADQKCQIAAASGRLSGTYLAWLSDSANSPATRMVKSTVPYLRLDGVPVAQSWADLTDGVLDAPIAVTELGGPPAALPSQCAEEAIPVAWTSTTPAGLLDDLGAVCDDWTSGFLITGRVGSPAFADAGWTAHCAASCAQMAALYCVEN